MNLLLIFILIHNRIAEFAKTTTMTFKKRMATYRMLEKMTGEPASLQINEAIIELQTLEAKNDKKTRMWYVYDDVIDQMRSSEADFSKAMSKYIPQQDVMIISASEQDDITVGFSTTIENNKKTQAMRAAFIAALAYPLFLVVTLLGVLYYFSTNVIQAMISNLPPEVNLSSTSQLLIGISNNFYVWFPTLIICLITLIIFVAWAMPNFVSKSRKFLEDLPPFNMYRIMVGCGFLFALNSLGKSGFMQIDALEQMLPLAKPYLRYRIQVIMELMADGLDVGQALIHSELNFPDKQMITELAIQIKYSEDDSLEVLSNTLADDGLATIKQQAKILNVLITFFVFATIGFLYMGVYGLGNDLGNIQSNLNNL